MRPYIPMDSLLRSIVQMVQKMGKRTATGLVIRSDVRRQLLLWQTGATEEEFEWGSFCISLLTDL